MPNNMTTFIPPYQLGTAVLFLVFNRLESTQKVFEEIRQAKPPRLYIAADGARLSRPDETSKVQAVRDYVTSHIDWDCEFKTLFRDNNLGCKLAVSSAIDWFFENEEMGIILEDDCLPDPTFFQFCQELLDRYQHDQRIGMISGDNFQYDNYRNDDSYYFSKYSHIWGWATWRDRWTENYDVTMAKWPIMRDEEWLPDIIGNKKEAKYWREIFERVHHGEIDTWDYQWAFANFLSGRVNIMPNKNLISNLGFNEDATHTLAECELANLPRESIKFPLNHPLGIFKNTHADNITEKGYINATKMRHILNKIMALLR